MKTSRGWSLNTGLTLLFSDERLDIMLLISKMEMSVINKMANVFVVNFITGEPWYLDK